MIQFLARRIVFAFLALVGATLLTFSLSRAAGDPRYLYAQEGGYGITQERWDALGEELGLDKPIVWQYAVWLGNIMRGNWQDSLIDRKSVFDKVVTALPVTLRLAFTSFAFASIIGIPLGVLSAVKRGTLFDMLGRGFALFGQALPVFWVGIMGILIFSVWLGWLPSATLGQRDEGIFQWNTTSCPP